MVQEEELSNSACDTVFHQYRRLSGIASKPEHFQAGWNYCQRQPLVVSFSHPTEDPMANPEHLAKLKESIEVRWPQIRCDMASRTIGRGSRLTAWALTGFVYCFRYSTPSREPKRVLKGPSSQDRSGVEFLAVQVVPLESLIPGRT